MATTPTLLKLPPELIIRISTHFTTPELGDFRGTCRYIESSLFDSFAKEFFTKRQFMLEYVSLEALVGIANHKLLSSRLQGWWRTMFVVDTLEKANFVEMSSLDSTASLLLIVVPTEMSKLRALAAVKWTS
jgi:hypothetical protein